MEQKKANVIFDLRHQSPESLSEAIEDMGFDSSQSEHSEATPVPPETQVMPTCTLQPAVEKLSHTRGILEVREGSDLTDLAVTFAPSSTSPQQLVEMVDSTLPLQSNGSRSPSPKDPGVSPSRKANGGVSLLKLCVEGMTCHSCVTTIEGKIGKLNGVEKIKGDVLERFTYS